MNPIRVLLADDNAAVLRAILRLLEKDFRVVATVSDGAALVRDAKRLMPDILVVDISMPFLTGLEALRVLTAQCVSCRVVVLTVHEEPEIVEEALAGGAYGYVLKSSADRDLPAAIRAAASGDRFVSPALRAVLPRGPA